MVPYSKGARFLIIVEAKSQLRIFKMDHTFGGTDKRAVVSWSTLRETVQTLLGLSPTENKVMFVANGWKTKFLPSYIFSDLLVRPYVFITPS